MQEWVLILLKTIGLFILVWAAVRLLGKKSLTQIDTVNFMCYFIIADVTLLASVNIIPLFYAFIVLIIWISLPIALDYLSIKSKVLHDLIKGKESVLIKHGKIMEENLLKTRMTGEDLLAQLRSKNVFNLADVEFAVMETNGEINPYLKSHKKPITAYDLSIKVAPQAESQTVALDGNLLEEPLASLGLTPEWLKTELHKMGVALENVFIAQVDSSGDLYLDLFDDVLQIPPPKVKEMLYATLEKCQADLTTFSLETENTEAKTMYSRNAQKLEDLLKRLRPYLLR